MYYTSHSWGGDVDFFRRTPSTIPTGKLGWAAAATYLYVIKLATMVKDGGLDTGSIVCGIESLPMEEPPALGAD
jgi:hypothetical protein